jgi:hypothetical protein
MATVNIDVKVSGKDRVEGVIEKVISALEPGQLSESVGKGADVFVGTVRAAAPKKSGRLAASVDKRDLGDATFHVGPHGMSYFPVQESGAFISPGHLMGPLPAPYPTYIRSAHIPGKHFMQAGFESGVEAATSVIKESILSAAGLE